ncbi:hypothetical protein C8R45DRAFT_1219097 [Mycena sanguinolenta]|nr:hypothetical protein C8R45DRAFT_1219097 [Mycena sanguinolenta]
MRPSGITVLHAIGHVFDCSGFETRERRERGAGGGDKLLRICSISPPPVTLYVPHLRSCCIQTWSHTITSNSDPLIRAYRCGLFFVGVQTLPRTQASNRLSSVSPQTTSLAVLLRIPGVFHRNIIAFVEFDTVRPVSSRILTHARVHISFLPRFPSYPDPEMLRIRVASWSRLGSTFISFRQAHTRCSDSFYATEWNGTESRCGAHTRQEYSTKFMAGKNARSKCLAIMRNRKQTSSATLRLHLHQRPCARAMSLPRCIHAP